MYAYIKGTLEEKAKDSIVIETAGIGYKIYISEKNNDDTWRTRRKNKKYIHIIM